MLSRCKIIRRKERKKSGEKAKNKIIEAREKQQKEIDRKNIQRIQMFLMETAALNSSYVELQATKTNECNTFLLSISFFRCICIFFSLFFYSLLFSSSCYYSVECIFFFLFAAVVVTIFDIYI